MKPIEGSQRFVRLLKRNFMKDVLKSEDEWSRKDVLAYLNEAISYGIANNFIREADGRYIIKTLNYLKYIRVKPETTARTKRITHNTPKKNTHTKAHNTDGQVNSVKKLRTKTSNVKVRRDKVKGKGVNKVKRQKKVEAVSNSVEGTMDDVEAKTEDVEAEIDDVESIEELKINEDDIDSEENIESEKDDSPNKEEDDTAMDVDNDAEEDVDNTNSDDGRLIEDVRTVFNNDRDKYDNQSSYI